MQYSTVRVHIWRKLTCFFNICGALTTRQLTLLSLINMLEYCPISDQKRNYPYSLLHFIGALNSRIRSFSSHLILLGDCKTTWVINLTSDAIKIKPKTVVKHYCVWFHFYCIKRYIFINIIFILLQKQWFGQNSK